MSITLSYPTPGVGAITTATIPVGQTNTGQSQITNNLAGDSQYNISLDCGFDSGWQFEFLIPSKGVTLNIGPGGQILQNVGIGDGPISLNANEQVDQFINITNVSAAEGATITGEMRFYINFSTLVASFPFSATSGTPTPPPEPPAPAPDYSAGITAVSTALGSINNTLSTVSGNITTITTLLGRVATALETIATKSTTLATNSTTVATNSTTVATNSTTVATNSTTVATNSTTVATKLTAIETYQKKMKELGEGPGIHFIGPYEVFGLVSIYRMMIEQAKILENNGVAPTAEQVAQSLIEVRRLSELIKTNISKEF
jgi:hypothetical protein